MSAHELEHGCGFRLKFASLQPDGSLDRDCAEEYATFLQEAPSGWSVTSAGRIETRFEYERDAWVFSDGDHEIAAVEHETGVEILVPLGVNLASAAIIGFATWAWSRWRTARAAKPKSAFVAHKVEERLPDGTERMVTTVTVRDATSKDVESVLQNL